MRATVLVQVCSALVFQIAAEDAAYVVKMNGVSMGNHHAEQVAAKENDRAKQADVASSLVEQASADHEATAQARDQTKHAQVEKSQAKQAAATTQAINEMKQVAMERRQAEQRLANANKEMKQAQAERSQLEQAAKQVDAEKSRFAQAAAKAKEEKQIAEDEKTKAEHVVAQANEEMKQARVEQSQAQHNAREAARLKASGKMLRAQEAQADSEVSRMTYTLIGLCILLAVFGSLVIVFKEQLSKAGNSLGQPLLADFGNEELFMKRNIGQPIVDGREQEIKDTACTAPTYVEWRFSDVQNHSFTAESLTECESKALCMSPAFGIFGDDPVVQSADGKDKVGADRIEWDSAAAMHARTFVLGA